MTESLADVGNLIVVIAGALGSLLLIVFKSRCKSICFGCIERDVARMDDEESAPIAPPVSSPPVTI
jgi:hypothetical protein|tara:strand:+ start:759 stop:956 length:198 start_codon:yes stop_codon:yes gene_type:complete